ncbi:MAG: hypothetical protein NZ529_01130 [Cytophagaceae bacterium]|nr:hypothetical protein [Cytophagaceae bacterium]MDW8455368.1 hypothetical protein [Cytophagaceae bacterium]
MKSFISLVIIYSLYKICLAQSIVAMEDFSLASPFNEPDGRNDIVKISSTDFISVAKTKGNVTGKSEFVIERYNNDLKPVWKTPLLTDVTEDYIDLYFNGKDAILLSVIHDEKNKKTTLVAYAFDINTGNKIWEKELESYNVGDWENNPHKGKVKESFIDIVCEHVNKNFVTPIEYKHNIRFSQNNEKFLSYVYNYGESNLSASLCVYDKFCNVIAKGKVSIDNNYVNHGIYLNNAGDIFIVNANQSGKLNIIRYDLITKDFDIMELPGANFRKDDFQVAFLNDDELYVACTESSSDGALIGVMYNKFDFKNKTLDKSVFEPISGKTGMMVIQERSNNKLLKGDEDWKYYDIAHFIIDKDEDITIILEKRMLYAQGYPHIARDVFDVSHKVEINGHVQTEGVIILDFHRGGELRWASYIPKNQIYAATDGLNSISFVFDRSHKNYYRFLYAYSEGLDGMITSIRYVAIDKNSGKKVKDEKLPNDSKLLLVREYTLWNDDNTVTLVGRKGLLGKSSSIVKIKLPN